MLETNKRGRSRFYLGSADLAPGHLVPGEGCLAEMCWFGADAVEAAAKPSIASSVVFALDV